MLHSFRKQYLPQLVGQVDGIGDKCYSRLQQLRCMLALIACSEFCSSQLRVLGECKLMSTMKCNDDILTFQVAKSEVQLQYQGSQPMRIFSQ